MGGKQTFVVVALPHVKAFVRPDASALMASCSRVPSGSRRCGASYGASYASARDRPISTV